MMLVLNTFFINKMGGKMLKTNTFYESFTRKSFNNKILNDKGFVIHLLFR